MRKRDAIDFYGSQSALARILGISPQAVHQWGERIPWPQAKNLHELTAGRLRYDPADYQPPGL